jgi:hypothetical protein
MRTFSAYRYPPGPMRLLLLALVAMLPAACVTAPPPPNNPFLGAWSTAEKSQIAFRDDTVVINPADAPPTPMNAQSCPQGFRFQYGRKSRDALLGLTINQPDVTRKLGSLLTQPEYPIAELRCDQGDNTYVLLNDRDLVAIYRDQGIAGVEELSRTGAAS